VAKLYTPQQVANILQVSVPTIKRWLLSGELPGLKIGPGGQWRVRSDVLSEYISRFEAETRRGGTHDDTDIL